MGLPSEFLEVRVVSLYGRTSYRAKCGVNDGKRLANVFRTLKLKFDIDPSALLKAGVKPGWFD